MSHPPRTPSTQGNVCAPSPPHRTPRTTRVPRNGNALPPRAMSAPPLRGPGRFLSPRRRITPTSREEHLCTHLQTTSQYIEEHLPHTAGISLPEPHPCQHHIPMTHHNHPHSHPPENITHPVHPERGHPFGSIHSHLHADTRHPCPHPCIGMCLHKGHTGQADTRHTTSMPTQGTDHTRIRHKNSNGAPYPTASRTTTKHVLDESTRDPRVTST